MRRSRLTPLVRTFSAAPATTRHANTHRFVTPLAAPCPWTRNCGIISTSMRFSSNTSGGGLMSRLRPGKPPPERWIIELTQSAELRASPDSDADVVASLPSGELLETFADLDNEGDWLLVRSPLEEHFDIMSEKPLQYQDGWIHEATYKRSIHQLGDLVNARTAPETHPVVNFLAKIPLFEKDGVPAWLVASFNEIYPGKIGGVVKDGRFMVQRPSGAMPERIASQAGMLLVPKQLKRRTSLAGFLGFVFASVVGFGLHAKAWLCGESTENGRMAVPQFVGWLTLIAVFVAPITTYPCYLFTNSQASTTTVVAWINLIFYNDLFGT